MAKKFSELHVKMLPDSRERSHAKAQVMLAKMPLNELRQARFPDGSIKISNFADLGNGSVA